MRYLITGTAGFIGFHLAKRLLDEGHRVIGIDGMTSYYDVRLKEARVAQLEQYSGFKIYRCMLEDLESLASEIETFSPEVVVHLAAQAGVRYSLQNPRAYIASNIGGSFNVLELCRRLSPAHLLIASTSSVYGASSDFPIQELARSDQPLSLYAASKKSVEVVAHSYSHLWSLPTTILRFFTAYGPWGRPDMALSLFVERILAGRPIDIYNHGNLGRDFTYIDDLVEAVVRLCVKPPARTEAGAPLGEAVASVAPYRIVNIGGGQPVSLLQFIEQIENALGMKARRNLMELQPGDVFHTEASTKLLEALIGYRPTTSISLGIPRFVEWYREYYRV